MKKKTSARLREGSEPVAIEIMGLIYAAISKAKGQTS